MPKREDIKSILIIGAGPIVIGQACEFDYSGAQACKALREEDYRVILVNSNPATIMTDPKMADATYIEPIEWRTIEKIIEKENIELHRLGKPEKNIPEFVSKVQLTSEAIENAKVKMKEELLAEGKPEKIIDNILKGKIARWIEDNTQLDKTHALLSQSYVMDDSKTVEQAIKDVDASIKLVDYVKFELGEGIEKKEEDFAAEVAAQMGK